MKCPNCDRENRDVARFCQYCGAVLTAVAPADAPPEETQAAEGEPSPAAGSAEQVNLSQEDRPEAPGSDRDPGTSQWEPGQELPVPQPALDEGRTSTPETPDADITIFPRVDDQEVDVKEGQQPVAEGTDQPKDDGPGDGSVLDDQALEPFEEFSSELDLVDVVSEQDLDQDREGTEPTVGPGEIDQVEQEPEPMPAEPPVLEPIPYTPLDAEEAAVQESLSHSLALGDSLSSDEAQTEIEKASATALPPAEGSLPTLDLGTVLNGRYQVVEVLQTKDQANRYQVRDLKQCPRCGFTGNSPDEAFCASCGALMEQKPLAIMQERADPGEEEPGGEQTKDYFQHENRHYWVWQEIQKESVREEQSTMRLTVGHRSDTGQVRELDEDSLFVLAMSSTYESITHQLGLFVVADGMGGHAGGEVASRLAIEYLVQALLRDLFSQELAGSSLSAKDVLDRMEDAVHSANDRVYLERQKRENDMGTTITAALVIDWTLHLAHVGDCRAYVWGQDGLQQLTTDHSVVAGMVAAGTIQPDELYSHPQRSVIYRSIGDRPSVDVDLSTHPLSPDDRLVLCCDGLWEMIHNEGIADVLLRESDPQTACDIMVKEANLAGGSDNISVIIVQL